MVLFVEPMLSDVGADQFARSALTWTTIRILSSPVS